MQQIEITTLSGQSPYNITMCDITKTYCYPVLSGVNGAPPTVTLNVPPQLEGTQELLVVVTDDAGCNTFHLYTCYTPTPTPTATPTPTPTPTMVISCNCISFDNPTSETLNFSYTQCNGFVVSYVINPETTLFVCGKEPSGDEGVVINISTPCVDNSCSEPTMPTIYYGKLASPTITSEEVVELSLLSRRQIVESYLQLPELTGYGYVIVPTSMRQPDTFRNSISECSEYVVPMMNQGEIIIEINGINTIYNVYRTFVTTSAHVDIWICN